MLTDKEQDNIQPGVSILVKDKKSDKGREQLHTSEPDEQRISSLRFRLKSLRNLLIYLLLFVGMTSMLLTLDGVPHLPQRVWSWAEIWDKLSGPAAGVPLDFIKYLTCSLGWFMLFYVGFTLVLEGTVDVFYLISTRLGGGQPGKVAISLKKATDRLPVSPLRRALDGLLLGAAFFAVVTSVAGGRGAVGDSSNDQTGSNSELDWQIYTPQEQSAAMVLETPDNNEHQATNYDQAESVVATPVTFNASFQLQENSPDFDSNYSSKTLSHNSTLVKANISTATPVSFYSQQQETVEVKHKVQAGDSLWKLAEQYYGEGNLYSKIYQANLGQPMGGGVHFPDSGIIQPGWILTIPDVSHSKMPGSAEVTSGVADNPQQEQAVYRVQPGDNMRAIAQKLLGDEMRWPEIWKLNANHTMPDGRTATNPDTIYPGWELKLPAKPAESSGTPAGQPQPQPTNNEYQLPGSSQEQPTGNNQNGQPQATNGQPQATVVTPAPVQSPSSSTTTAEPVQPGTMTNPVPTTTPSTTATPAPVVVTPTPHPQAQPVVTQTATPRPEQHQTDQQPEKWLWQVIEGVGALLTLTGVGFGLRKVGAALRKRWKRGELAGLKRSRWQTYREVTEWEVENTPQLRSTPVITLNERGEESGFAFTERPLELLKLRADGFDVDRARLILHALQSVFTQEGLPQLSPVSCIEAGRKLTFHFTGSPQMISAYLTAMNKVERDSLIRSKATEVLLDQQDPEFAGEDEDVESENETSNGMSAGKGKILSFLRNGRRTENEGQVEQTLEETSVHGELIEAIVSKLGGQAWVEKQREGLIVTLEGVELRFCYNLVSSVQVAPGVNNVGVETDPASSEVVGGVSVSEEIEKPGLFSRPSSATGYFFNLSEADDEEVYQAYEDREEEALAEDFSVNLTTKQVEGLQERTYVGVREEFAQVSNEDRAGQLDAGPFEAVEQALETPLSPLPGYIFFSIGAVVTTADQGGAFEPNPSSQVDHPKLLNSTYGHFQLCLDTCNNLLLVSAKGDEAAQTVLYSAVFHLAAAGSPEELALYLVNRPITLSDEDLQNAGQEFGLNAEAQVTFSEEVKHNQEVFKGLAELPQTVAVVAGNNRDAQNSREDTWAENTNILIETLLEELIGRKTRSAENSSIPTEEGLQPPDKLPRLVLIISDLAAVATTPMSSNGTEILVLNICSKFPGWIFIEQICF